MIELILMIAVVVWFVTTAKKMNKNKILWGIIGALSYYIPILFFWIINLSNNYSRLGKQRK